MIRDSFKIDNITISLEPIEEDYAKEVYVNNIMLKGEDDSIYDELIAGYIEDSLSTTIYADGERIGVLCVDVAKPIDILGFSSPRQMRLNLNYCSSLLEVLGSENGLFINIAYLEPRYRGLGIMAHIIFEKFELEDIQNKGSFPFMYCITNDKPFNRFWKKHRFHEEARIPLQGGEEDILALNPIWRKE